MTLAELRDRFACGPLVLDGAMGTELERRRVAGGPAASGKPGSSSGQPAGSALWSAAALRHAPEVVAAIHREYAAAGAEILVANTFRSNPRTLRAAGLLAEGPELNRLAVELARAAAGSDEGARRCIVVAASVAPAADCYRPDLVPPEDELRAEHGLLAEWLAAAGPDLAWIETMGTVREARIAAEAVAAHGLPFVVSFVTREDGALLGGEALEDAVAAIEPLGPLAIGLNCIPPDGVSAQVPPLRAAVQQRTGTAAGLRRPRGADATSPTRLPLVAYAHIGNPRPTPGWSYSQAVMPAEYAACALRWVAGGVTIVGGCCGTTPAHIRAVREALDASEPDSQTNGGRV